MNDSPTINLKNDTIKKMNEYFDKVQSIVEDAWKKKLDQLNEMFV